MFFFRPGPAAALLMERIEQAVQAYIKGSLQMTRTIRWSRIRRGVGDCRAGLDGLMRWRAERRISVRQVG